MNSESKINPSGWFHWPAGEASSEAELENLEKRYHQPGIIRRVFRFLLPGHVSRIHLYEAQERYLNLCRMLEYHKDTPCSQGQDPKEKQQAIGMCLRILRDAKYLLTRRQNDLNFLWREMTRVHIMIVEKVLPEGLLPTQLDFCREEARRLAALKEPEVDDMLQRLAEVTQEDDVHKNKERMIRVIRALIERFTTIRTGRMHHQFVNIGIYQLSLVVLIPIVVILLANHGLMTKSQPIKTNIDFVFSEWPALTCTDAPSGWGCVVALPFVWLGAWLKFLFAGAAHLLTTNILAYIFFAGLTGGFFSVVIRLRNRELIPGEDAYFVWYVLSKPFIGALGAVILFILLTADYVTIEVMRDSLARLKAQQVGPFTFGFGFLAGFSERFVFPEFR